MRIGVLGSGGIGGSLGRLWASRGHEVLFSSRHPERLQTLADRAGNGACVGSPDDAIAFADTILDALPFGASIELDAEALAGKHLISASNYYPGRDGEIDLAALSQSEFLARRLPHTRVTKAFNMMFAQEMERRANGEDVEPLAIFYAGDDAAAKEQAARLIEDARFCPIDAGALANGTWFETEAALYARRLSPAEASARLEAETA